MADRSELVSRLEQLQENMDLGVRTVETASGQRITYRDFHEMQQAAKALQRRIDEIDGKPRRRLIRLNSERGL